MATLTQQHPPCPEPIERCLHHVITERAFQDPNAPAICAWDGDFSYARLDELSTRLAHHLASLLIESESIVPICFEKSAWAVVAMLGIMKASGAFVPLDPSYPMSRTQLVLREVKAQVILASPQTSSKFIDIQEMLVIVSESAIEKLPKPASPLRLKTNVTPQNAMYVLFTSGSTGMPKGVVVEHVAACSSISYHGPVLGFDTHSRVFQFASYTFDASIAEIFTTLFFGGCICVPSDAERMSNTAGAISRMMANWLFVTPSVLRLLDPDKVSSLRTLAVGGEADNKDNIEKWAEKLRMMAVYGPTECCIFSSVAIRDISSRPTHIGWAVGCSSWVVDLENPNQLAPSGTIGELLIQGPILARGYLNDSVKTGKAFITDPPWLHKGPLSGCRRFYKTGDMVRCNPDGSMDFVGRRDSQVKVNGQRIELGEIEYQIQCDERVGLVTVILPATGYCRQRLVAVLTLRNLPGAIEPAEDGKEFSGSHANFVASELSLIKESLLKSLPLYMHPAAWWLLPSMPLSTSGKTDRKLLQSRVEEMNESIYRQITRVDNEEDSSTPLTEIEGELQKLCSRVLQRPSRTLGLTHSFIALGGDSLRAMELVNIARSEGITLEFQDIMRAESLTLLAQMVNTSSHLVDRNDDGGHIPLELPAVQRHLIEKFAWQADDIEAFYPCTAMQQGMMISQMKRPGEYHVTSQFEIVNTVDDGVVSSARLQEAWTKVVSRHSALRTVFMAFDSDESSFAQVVLNHVSPEITIHDSCGRDALDPLAAAVTPNYAVGKPHHRLHIFPISKNKIICHLDISHLICDGDSLSILLRDLRKAYEDKLPSETAPRYSGYVQYLQKHPLGSAVTYWTAYLAGVKPCHFPAAVEMSGNLRSVKVEFKQNARLSDHCAKYGVTKASILQAIWALILRRYTGTCDTCFGCIVSGRAAPIKDMQDAVGVYINMIVFRVNLSGKETLIEAVKQVKEDFLEGQRHQHCSLATVQQALQLGGRALFNTAVSIQAVREADSGDAAILWRKIHDYSPTEFAMTLNVVCSKSNMDIALTFWESSISEDVAAQVGNTFSSMLSSFAEDPNVSMSSLDLVPSHEKKQLAQWNGELPVKVETCIQDVFEEWAFKTPDAVAICSWDGNLTYSRLSSLSMRLANRLIELGVGALSFVPLYFEKSTWTVVAMLAVLKAGGAFIPLDPSHPMARSLSLIQKVGARIILVSSDFVDKFSNLPICSVVVSEAAIEALPPAAFKVVSIVAPRNPMYVIFTSGSTGEPKGVVVDHLAACSSISAQGKKLGFDQTSRVFQFASYTFDASITEIWTTLFHGGCVCIPLNRQRLDDIAGAIVEMGVNWALLTPSVARLISPAEVPSLRTLCIGGESVGQDLIDIWAGKVRLKVAYGPTECSVICSSGSLVRGKSQPKYIGRASGCLLWIVNPENHHQLMAIGAVGELLVQGPIVAQGYLDSPETTANKFISAPSWLEDFYPGMADRFYKTGDFVQYQVDGSISYVGRIDAQRKFNGQRIEMGEIEYQINAQLPDLRQAVVEIVEARHGVHQETLVAFICFGDHSNCLQTCSDGQILRLSAHQKTRLLRLQKILRTKLPAYMVPSHFFPLRDISITTSGKVDRKSLAQYVSDLPEDQFFHYSLSDAVKRPPSTDLEKRLQKLWAKVLQIREDLIGAEDSFVQLGGHSYEAIQLSGEARRDGIVLSVETVFRNQTLSQMALSSRFQKPSQGFSSEVLPFSLTACATGRDALLEDIENRYDIPRDIVEDVYPCTPLQAGLMALTSKQPGAYIVQRVFKVTEMTQKATGARLRAAWESIIRESDILRTRIIDTKAIGLCQVVLRSPIEFVTSSNVSEYLDADKSQPMGLGQPLTRFGIVEEKAASGPKCRFFVWTIHHALYDGWSMPKLVDRVSRVYNDIQTPQIPRFSSFIKYLNGINAKESERFWKSKFEKFSSAPFPMKPSVHYQPHVDSSVFGEVSINKANGSKITQSNIIRAAWALLVSRFSDTCDLAFGAVHSGRNASLPGVDEIIGPTITTVPVRVQIDHGQSVQEYLSKIQDDAWDMIPFEQAGLQNISRFNSECKIACEFQNLLVVQAETPAAEYGEQQLGLEDITPQLQGFVGCSLVTECKIENEKVGVRMYHDSKVISGQQVHWVMNHFCHVVTQLSSVDGGVTVGEVELASPEDVSTVMAWNKAYPETVKRCIHQVIEEQVHLQPDAPAICAWDGDLSYAQLDYLATHLSYRLIQLGVGPGTYVPLCFEKSGWTIVAMFAVLKAGGAFVPLGYSQPPRRLQEICSDINAKLMLTSARYSGRYDSFGIESLVVDAALMGDLPSPMQDFRSAVMPQNPAYIIFTSGTTGTPKGVLIEHAAFCSGAAKHGDAMLQKQTSRVLQFASYSFDASLVEILTPLMHGACVCVPDEESRVNNLAGAINDMKITWAVLTPSVSRLLSPAAVPGLETLVLAGEPMSMHDVATWSQHLNLVNAYGPSECSVLATANLVRASDESASNIGRVVGCLSWVVDPENLNRLAPLGCIGELLIEGPTLARGYINRPDETTDAFTCNPLWVRNLTALGADSGRRMYRTGDLVRYRSDGSMEFAGRKDTQAKLRGQRIELGEIEYQARQYLTETMHVDLDVVADIFTEARDRQVLALFFPTYEKLSMSLESGGLVLDISDSMRRDMGRLRTYLSQSLPAYMIPSVYLPVASLPKSISGKIDRKRLRALGAGLSATDLAMYSLVHAEKVAPTTEMERKLQGLWAHILKMKPSDIGANGNFLDLGGDSLNAMRLAGDARMAGIRLTVGLIFEHPVLMDMAISVQDLKQNILPETLLEPCALVGGKQAGAMEEAAKQCGVLVDIIEDVYPCTPLQAGLMALAVKKPGTYVYRDVFRLPPTLDLERFCGAWEAVVHATAILRTRIIYSDIYESCQAVLRMGIKWQKGADVDAYMRADEEMAMEYGTPLSRFGLVVDAECGAFFVWTLHHALYDGWSLPRILGNVQSVYNGALLNPAPPFVTFVSHLRAMLGPKSDEFWRSELSNASPVTFPQLPSNHYQPCAAQNLADALLLPHERPSGITMPTIIRAAWALLVAKYTDTDDLVFGVIQAGRQYDMPGITEMIGPTITTVPVRMKLDYTLSVEEYLRNVQGQARRIFPFEHAGLQNIRRLSKGCAAACDFQSLLDVQPLGVEGNAGFLGLERVRMPVKGCITYLLVVQCFYGDENLEVNFSYDPGALQEQDVRQMMAQFRHVIGQLLDNKKQCRIGDIDLLSPEDESSIWEWNKEYPEALEACMHDMIWERARMKPDLFAVCSWDGKLTYRELDEKATKLARFLVSIGVGAETMVPLCFEKSVWAIVSMLAVMKAGGAFVSLDPSHPAFRLETLVRDVGAKVLITSTSYKQKLAGLADTVVGVGSMNHLPPNENTKLVISRVSPDNAAYAVFTSGSTGKPKGIIVEHRAFCSSARAHGATMRLGEGSRVLQFAAYTFDASIGDIFTTLMHGGCVCVPSEEERMSDLAGVINRLNINTACLTPTVASLLDPADVPTLKVLSLGGEVLKRDNLNAWADQVHLINIYGPAECTIWCAGLSGMTRGSQPANIGRGIGALLWVVEASAHDTLCPIGCVGELLIEGPVLARGYLNEMEKTAAAFIVNPTWLSGEQNSGRTRRFYKTGDLVRLNPDSSITFIGRKDNQVKLHGHRIELGEIEHHITSHLFVRHSIVDLPLLGPYKQSLVAILSFRQYETPEGRADEPRLVENEYIAAFSKQVADISGALSQVLPRHLVPKTWVGVQDIPLLASGKTNRKLARKWLEEISQDMYREIARRQVLLHDTDPGLLLEEHEETARLVAEKVIQLLHGKGNDLHDLRGRDLVLSRVGLDSVQMVSLATFIRKRFGVNTLKHIFANPQTTVRSISRLIMEHEEAESWVDILKGMDLLAEYRTLSTELLQSGAKSDVKRVGGREATESILITGVTGFLGSEILKQVLERPETMRAMVLVRAKDLTQARERVVNAAKMGLWWDDSFGDRLEIWLGDLAQPRLGLGETEWDILTGKESSAGHTVDAIIHNGAVVHWGADYTTLKAINVGSTMEILKALSQSVHPPRFTFVSGGHMSLGEEDEETTASMLASGNGYSQTKFISELLIKDYARREARLRSDGCSGLSIVKPGLIIGAADRGVSNIDDYIWRVVSSAIKINALNAEDTNSWLMIAGADQVASLIISKCTHDTPESETMLSIHDGMTLGDFWTILNRDFGFGMRPLKAHEWLDELARDVDDTGTQHPLWPVLHILQENGGALGIQERPGVFSEMSAGVEGLRMSVKRSIEYLLKLGYLGVNRKEIRKGTAFSRSIIINTR